MKERFRVAGESVNDLSDGRKPRSTIGSNRYRKPIRVNGFLRITSRSTQTGARRHSTPRKRQEGTWATMRPCGSAVAPERGTNARKRQDAPWRVIGDDGLRSGSPRVRMAGPCYPPFRGCGSRLACPDRNGLHFTPAAVCGLADSSTLPCQHFCQYWIAECTGFCWKLLDLTGNVSD